MFIVYSDGGADRGGRAAAAAIVELPSGERRRVVAHLGSATNNEAEIVALLMSLAAVRAIRNASSEQGYTSQVTWYADSEYTLLSATQYIRNWEKNGWKTSQKEPVKNQGLWRVYLRLAHELQIRANHVRGHTGHSENESCDGACNWLKSYAEEWDREPIVHSLPFDDGEWLVVDLEAFLERIREFEPRNPERALILEAEQLLFTPIAELSRLDTPGSVKSRAPVDEKTRYRVAAIRALSDFREKAAKLPGDMEVRDTFLAQLDDLAATLKV